MDLYRVQGLVNNVFDPSRNILAAGPGEDIGSGRVSAAWGSAGGPALAAASHADCPPWP